MSFIQTLSGKQFDYLSATIDDIDIEDIAVALSNICRFSGHLPEFYSVAQHSVLCSQLVSPEFAFEALMHNVMMLAGTVVKSALSPMSYPGRI